MKSKSKGVFKKIYLYLLLAVLGGVVIFLFLPGNYYVREALMHLMPKIDQYTIFENRVVKAEDPQPWELAPNVETNQISPEFTPDFKKYGTVGFVVVQHNKIILEQYWHNYSPLSLSNSFSMAKSIISLLVGCAISDGKIKSVVEPVHDFLPEWTSFDGKTLTIKDLLTMSAGVEWDESYNSLFSKTTEAYYGNDLWKLVLTEKLIEKPGVRFNYQSGVSQMLAFIVQKATGKKIADYASEKLWTPIHAEQDAMWSLDRKSGMEKAYCCFNTNARDFARLGQLILNKGSWDSTQVVDSNYIREATKPATWLKFTRRLRPGETTYREPIPCNFYGYQFWLLNYQGLKVINFRGMLGQYILVIPQLDAVIVRLGTKSAEEFNVDQEYPKDIEVWLNAGIDAINRQK
ncbi:MAG: serine hydrolase [Paludibacter sp.]|nr:serine hydrolase [Paludibacter sp.]